jgi:hypothetical protein
MKNLNYAIEVGDNTPSTAWQLNPTVISASAPDVSWLLISALLGVMLGTFLVRDKP